MNTHPTPPSDHLRRLTVFVDEPDPGEFYWVLIESTGDATVWEEAITADGPAATWVQALDAGIDRLKTMTLDLAVGPRALGEDENASPVG